MAVNDVRVREIIDQKIQQFGGADGPNAAVNIRAAWQDLKAWRDEAPAAGRPPNSLDLDHAAAENYMYARASVADGFVSQAQMNTLAVGYYLTKRLGMKMPTSGNPQSEVDAGVLRWGVIGAQEGEVDRIKYRFDTKAPLWRPVNEIMPLSGYTGLLGRPGTRYSVR